MRIRDSRQRGTSLVETTLCIVTVLSLLIAVVTIGQMVMAYTAVTNAAREGARYAMVNGADSGRTITGSDVSTYVQTKFAPGLDPAQLTVTTNWCVSHNT